MNAIETSPLKPFLGDHYETEAYIKASGIPYTFLQHSLYADVLPMFIGPNPVETGVDLPVSGAAQVVDLAAQVGVHSVACPRGHAHRFRDQHAIRHVADGIG